MPDVAESYLLAIWANRDTGKPFSGSGRIGHVVRVGPNLKMPIVQEFSDGGVFEHEDCAPASMMSRCLEGGVKTTIRELEELAGTSLNGTGFPGCIKALEHFGIAAALASSAPSGFIMNPMLPAVVPVSEFPRYLAASQRGNCFVSMAGSVAPVPPPAPTPIPDEEEAMFLATAGVRPSSEGPDPHNQSAVYLCSGTAAQPGFFKRYFSGNVVAAIGEYEAMYGKVVENFNPFVLDRMLELPEITDDYVTYGPGAWVTRPAATPDPAA